jgi:uncharacterized membrane protein
LAKGKILKKNILAIILLLFCTYIYSIEFQNVGVNLSSPRNIGSNSVETFVLSISNRGNATLYNLELSVIYNDDLIIALAQTRVYSLEPRETVRIDMEIINNSRYFFDKETFVILRMLNEEYESNFRFRFVIRSIENFWFFAILSLASVIICLFIIIYIKVNKGDRNAG